MKYVLEFVTPDDWKPMIEAACWVDCPFSILTSLGMYTEQNNIMTNMGEIICPVITKRVQKGIKDEQKENK